MLGPFMVRLAWHDAGTFNKDSTEEWPKAGGANGSIRFEPEVNHGANAGLSKAFDLLVPIKEQFPAVSYADLIQMASARAIETGGGPKLGIRYGRADVASADDCVPEGLLPHPEPDKDTGVYGDPNAPVEVTSKKAEGHLRKVFYRMGFDDEAIVALSGAHTLGRAWGDRSGMGKDSTKFTNGSEQSFADGTKAPYTTGGSSWTEDFFVFDNSYFKVMYDENADEELLKMSSDMALFKDEAFTVHALRFKDNQDAFFESYARAHKQLSEQGSKFSGDPILLN
eukprot:jgi/Psemu1/318392/estExt_fgenesh1_pm.C_700024